MKMIDLHCDTLLLSVKPDKPKQVSYFRKNDGMVDIEKLKMGESIAQFFAIYIPVKNLKKYYKEDITPFDFVKLLYKNYLNELDLNKEFLVSAKNYEELINNQQNGKISAILTIEEGGILEGKISRLNELYEMGVRLISLTWNYENCIGYPNSKDINVMRKGLKDFGIQTIKKMNELGMIIDVSHISDGGFWDIVKYSNKPFVASHSNSRAITNHTRNLTDEMLKAIANCGGTIGMNYCPKFVYDKNNSKKDESKVVDIVKHIKHIKNVAGIDAISLGSDFDGISGKLEIENCGQVNKLYNALEKEGFTTNELEKIWYKNALRVIKEVLR